MIIKTIPQSGYMAGELFALVCEDMNRGRVKKNRLKNCFRFLVVYISVDTDVGGNCIHPTIMSNEFKVILFIFFTSLLLGSCVSTFYQVAPVELKSKCDTIYGRYNIRIVNVGKIGISSVSLNTDSGFVTFRGVKPGDTSCYFRMPPLYKNAEYKIFALRYSWFGKAYSYSFGVLPLYHIESEKLKSGFYTFNVELSRNHMIPGVNKKKRKIYAGRTWISTD